MLAMLVELGGRAPRVEAVGDAAEARHGALSFVLELEVKLRALVAVSDGADRHDEHVVLRDVLRGKTRALERHRAKDLGPGRGNRIGVVLGELGRAIAIELEL